MYICVKCIYHLHFIFYYIASLCKSKGTGNSLSTSNLSTLLFKLLKLIDTFLNLSMPNLSTWDFKLDKSLFLEKSDVSTIVAFF